jgi:hypothetical protein
VPRLADRSPAELDAVFGRPTETKALEKGGQYRLYPVAGQPQGLAVRFYGGRAKSFNLLLAVPVSSSKDALKRFFSIDVGRSPPARDPQEPLTEKYAGTFGGVKFAKVSAKRDENGRGYVFVLAEVGN